MTPEKRITELPAALRRTLTWDQGWEMAEHGSFTVDTGVEVFFCDPHSPWQRGSNENANGLLRRYFPKGTNFGDVTDRTATAPLHPCRPCVQGADTPHRARRMSRSDRDDRRATHAHVENFL